VQTIPQSFRSGIAGVGLALAALAAPAAHAAYVDQWTVDVNSYFSNVMPGSVTVSGDQKTLSWGTGSNGPSSLAISGAPTSGVVDTNGSQVANFSVTHTNNVLDGNSATLSGTKIIADLVLTPTGGGASIIKQVTFDLSFTETTNSLNPCPNGSPNNTGFNINGCGDIFVFGDNALNASFDYEDHTYYLSFLEFTAGLNPLPNAACSAAGASAPCIGFQTAENKATTVQFSTMITSERVVIPVSEPGMLGLLGLALAGMAGALRRRKSA